MWDKILSFSSCNKAQGQSLKLGLFAEFFQKSIGDTDTVYYINHYLVTCKNCMISSGHYWKPIVKRKEKEKYPIRTSFRLCLYLFIR